MININSALITIWGKMKQLKDDVFSAISGLQGSISGEASARENAISGLQNSLDLKEDTLNKVNEIVSDPSLKQYLTTNSAFNKFGQYDATLQAVADSVPYVSQARGNSTTDVMSQKAVSDSLDAIEQAVSLLAGSEIEFPEIDLSGYATTQQVESAIFDVTGDLVQLDTTDKASLVSAINENKSRIDNNVLSISGMQMTISGMATDNTNAINGLQTQINTNKTKIANIEDAIDLTNFETYMLLNPINL